MFRRIGGQKREDELAEVLGHLHGLQRGLMPPLSDTARRAIERYDRVRLVQEVSHIPAGTEGTVMLCKAKPQMYWVQFEGYGAHEVPEESVERVEDEANR